MIVAGGLKLSAMEIADLSKQIEIAKIEGKLLRAYQSGVDDGHLEGYGEGHLEGYDEGHLEGIDEGCEKTRKGFVTVLLNDFAPEEISEKFEIPLEEVLKIKNGN